MAQPTAIDPLDDLVGKAVGEYFQCLESGQRPQLRKFIERYPEISDLLKTVIPALQAADGSPDASAAGGVASQRHKQLGDFRILRQIGRGGMGIVYEAEQISMNRRVALKVLPLAGLVDEMKIRRFQNEVRAVAALDHPNIVSVYTVGEERGVHYFSMQLIRGRSLSEVISSLRRVRDRGERLDRTSISQITSMGGVGDRGEPDLNAAREPVDNGSCQDVTSVPAETVAHAESSTIPHSSRREYFRSVVALGIQAASALQHAHEQGVIHRDVKPANLMLDASARLYVTDFGLARIEADTGVTMTGDLIGTLRYMAPEQALANRGILDHRADIYSLAATLYELLTLQPAYLAADRQELLTQIAFEEPAPLRRIDREIPAELDTIIHKAMSKDMDRRYGSAQALADDLRSHLENRPIKAKPPTPSEIISKWARRNTTLTWAASITMLLVTLTLAASTLIISRQLARTITSEQFAKSESHRLARHIYLLHVSNADKSLLDNRYARARSELDACPQKQRGWEWRYLAARLQAAFPLTLPGSEQPIFTRDGKRLIAIGRYSTAGKHSVRVWNLETGKVVNSLEHDSEISHIAVSADENRIAGGDNHGKLFVWDIESGRTLWSVQVHADPSQCDGLAFSPDGRLIASGGSDHTIVVVDATSGQPTFRKQCSGWTRKVTFSPDGRWIATGVSGNEPAMLINSTSGEIAAKFLPGGDGQVPTFDPGGQRIFTGSDDGSIKVWNWDGKQLVEVSSWRDAGGKIQSLDVNSDGTRLVSTSNWPCIAHVWDATTGKKLASLDTQDNVYWSAFAPNGDEVALFSVSSGIRFWRWVSQGRDNGLAFRALDGAVKAKFNADGKLILASTPMYFHGGNGPRGHHFPPEPAAIFSAESENRILTLNESVYEASWSPDGRGIVATSASDDAIRSYDIGTGKRLRNLPLRQPVNTISRVVPASRRCITFSKRGTMRLIDFASGKEDVVHHITQDAGVMGANFSRNGDLLAFTLGFRVEIWDTHGATRLSELTVPGHWVKRLVFSDDGHRLYAGAHGGELMEIDVATGEKRTRFVGHVGAVLGIALSPDGSQIVSGDNSSGQVIIWDVVTGQQMITLAEGGQPITSLDWSSDGRRIVAGKQDGTVQIWTLPSSP